MYKKDLTMEWPPFIEMLFRLAEPYLSVRNDLLHTQVAHQYCLRLLSAEGGDQRIVEPAVILHDVGWSKLPPEQLKIAFGIRAGGPEARRLNRIHEVEGAVIAGRLLQTLNYDPGLIEQITEMIERHDSGKHPESLEEKMLKDADKLWRYSGVGFRQEVERQGVGRHEMVRFLERLLSALFTPTALLLAEEELKTRAREIGTT
ncbi:MAG: HD domain-containing protein [Deltaproteobacteria bacterium]|nr:HD domain-containing protein [Deltaproteobacteria bacterium]